MPLLTEPSAAAHATVDVAKPTKKVAKGTNALPEDKTTPKDDKTGEKEIPEDKATVKEGGEDKPAEGKEAAPDDAEQKPTPGAEKGGKRGGRGESGRPRGRGGKRRGKGENGKRNGRGKGRQNRDSNKQNAARSGSARVLYVSGQSPVKQVAGAISWISREGECPRLLATNAAAINQASKAVAIARKFLEDERPFRRQEGRKPRGGKGQSKIDIAVLPMYTPGRARSDESFTFILRKSARSRTATTRGPIAGLTEDGTKELKVSQNSNPGTVAGAIAARVREGQRVVLTSIGSASVAKAVTAVAIGRQYLQEDGVDIMFRPSFLNIQFPDGRRSSCLQFQLLAHQI